MEKESPFVANRRRLLAKLIDDRFEKKQIKLIEHIAMKTGQSINQGELSGLLNGKKSFGDKKGRKLAAMIGLDPNYFEQSAAMVAKQTTATYTAVRGGSTSHTDELSAREEIVVELFRRLEKEQQSELMKGLRALDTANDFSKKFTGGKLGITGNRRVEQTLGFPSPARKKPKTKPGAKRKPHASAKPQPRDPGTAADDFMDR